MNRDEIEITEAIAQVLVDRFPAGENDAIEDQFRYHSLRLGLLMQRVNVPQNLAVEQQERLIPVYKKFIQECEDILKGGNNYDSGEI